MPIICGFYLPEIKSRIKNAKSTSDFIFKSGILGGYFARNMLPKKKLNKIKTFKDKNPIHAKLDKNLIDRFLSQQAKLLELLEASGNVSLNRVRVPISVSRLIMLKLGDTFQFFINHMIRHFKQIERLLPEKTVGETWHVAPPQDLSK